MRLAVVIVNYRTAELAIDCLRSLSGQVSSARVIVCDNASGDGSVDRLAKAIEHEEWTEWTQLESLSRNGGFAYGNNRGIERAMSLWWPDYVLLLNPDTVVRDGALAELVAFMDVHPDAGIAGSRLEDSAGRVQRSAHHFHSSLGELLAGARSGWQERKFPSRVVSPMAESEARECDWVSGASLIVRREVFEQIGLMDEWYFLYFEEVDFCWKAKRAGWQVWYTPESHIMHLEGQATDIVAMNRRRPAYWFDSRRRFFVKHYGVKGLILADIMWALGRASFSLRRCLGLAKRADVNPRRFAVDLLLGDIKAVFSGKVCCTEASVEKLSMTIPERAKDRSVGIVAIGRNEGERLRECLESLVRTGSPIVYVDSGSTDQSVSVARRMGAAVVELDMSVPFSAARARNVGLGLLNRIAPDLENVQFIDGDCVLHPEWLDRALAVIEGRPAVAVVCGRTRERYRNATIYNRLCDMEWDVPVGETKACGGIALMRIAALKRAGGFREDVIAAEDDEVCLRIRRGGGKVIRTGDEMALHDAAMTRFSQWWRRAKRAGHAYAQGSALHGASPERHFVKPTLRILFWSVVLPMLALIPAWWTRGWSLLILAGYPVLAIKTYFYGRKRGWNPADSKLYAGFTVLDKFPGLLGILQYWRMRLMSRRPVLIEYKGVADHP